MNFRNFKSHIILLVIGAFIALIGSILKILHWEFGFINAELLLFVGGMIELVAGGWILIKLIQIWKNRA